jgi:hypothetical protein
MEQETRPAPPSRASTRSSKKSSLSLDLSNLPPLTPPTPPSNTLIFTNLQSLDIFQPDNLQQIRDLINKVAPIHAWSPLRSFRRIVVSFYDEEAAIAVRQIWDGTTIRDERCRVYFGQPTPISAKDEHLALPDAGKLFFISPPPSPPHGWEMKLEDAPNKMVHADDLAAALAKLRHHNNTNPGGDGYASLTPVSPIDSKADETATAAGGKTRSRSSTLLFMPEHASSPDLPCVTVDDMTDEPMEMSPLPVSPLPATQTKPIMAHTARPPVELMHVQA